MILTKTSLIIIIFCAFFIFFCVFFIVIASLISGYFIMQQNVHNVADKSQPMPPENIHTYPIKGDIKRVCTNPSLNARYKTGSIVKKPFQTMCETKTTEEEGLEKFYQKFKPYVSYNQYVSHDQYVLHDKENGIYGANYMNYNDKSSPYNIGLTLYDKDAPINTPVSANYSQL
jgi:hypothetical protein